MTKPKLRTTVAVLGAALAAAVTIAFMPATGVGGAVAPSPAGAQLFDDQEPWPAPGPQWACSRYLPDYPPCPNEPEQGCYANGKVFRHGTRYVFSVAGFSLEVRCYDGQWCIDGHPKEPGMCFSASVRPTSTRPLAEQLLPTRLAVGPSSVQRHQPPPLALGAGVGAAG